MEGGRISLTIGLFSAVVTSLAGLIIGVSAGFLKEIQINLSLF